MRGTLSLYQRTSQLLFRGRRRATNETYTLIPSISYCTNIDNNTIDGLQSPRVKIFDREFKRKQRDRAAWLMRPGLQENISYRVVFRRFFGSCQTFVTWSWLH
ncbi:hypothetical protein OIU77_004572 [Salix suchowensis]|uniref:Uncharacterized protein n=1 Tax=Salix suchowensis TaxID=1278906 RepID=A0ABQ9AX49_9ROSI|nr:hypothetical protein OIU77_004572 [Salix suchowensis]